MEFDKYADEYSSHVGEALPPGIGNVDKFARIKVRHLLNELERRSFKKTSISILDVGCGVGITDKELSPFCPNITGLDTSKISLELAQLNNPGITYTLYDGGDFPFGINQFDVVLAICVIHHIPPPQWSGFFEQIYRVLKPGGIMLIYEHNPWNPLTQWVVSRCKFDQDAVLVSAGKCKTLAEKAGFIEQKTSYILFTPLQAAFWIRIEESLLSFVPIGAQYQFSALKNTR